MFSFLAGRLVNKLEADRIISESEREIYLFGAERLVSLAVNFISFLVLMLLLNEIPRGLIFLLSFTLLRPYVGGYHAKTKLRCYILSVISVAAVLLFLKFVEIDILITFECLVFFGIVIILFAPVEAVNNPLDEIEKIIYRRRAILIWIIETVAAIVLIVFNLQWLALAVICAHGLSAISALIGKFVLSRSERFEEEH